MKSYQRRVVFVDLSRVDSEDDMALDLYGYNGTGYKLISVNQHENKLVYTLEREIEEY